MAPRLKAFRLRLVLLDIRIDDAGDVVFVLLDLLEQIVVFLFLVFDFFEFFRFHRFLGCGRLALFAFGLGIGLDQGLGLDDFLFLDLAFGRGLFFDLLVLGLFRFLVFGFHLDRLYGLRHARAALLQKHFGFEGEGAFRTFDRALLQVVKTSRAAGTDAVGSEIGLDQAGVSYMWTKGRRVCHEPVGLSKSMAGLDRAIYSFRQSRSHRRNPDGRFGTFHVFDFTKVWPAERPGGAAGRQIRVASRAHLGCAGSRGNRRFRPP